MGSLVLEPMFPQHENLRTCSVSAVVEPILGPLVLEPMFAFACLVPPGDFSRYAVDTVRKGMQQGYATRVCNKGMQQGSKPMLSLQSIRLGLRAWGLGLRV